MPGRPNRGLRFAMLGMLGLLIFGFVAYRVWDNADRLGLVRHATWTVTARHWTRAIPIEQDGTWTDAHWCKVMKRHHPDARDVTREKRSSGTRKVKVGERCRGSGVDRICTPEYEQEPVYEDFCTFTWDGFKEVDLREREGAGSVPREWPKVELEEGQREGRRRETLTVTLDAGDEPYDCLVPEELWMQMTPGSQWVGTQSYRYGTVRCDALSRLEH